MLVFHVSNKAMFIYKPYPKRKVPVKSRTVHKTTITAGSPHPTMQYLMKVFLMSEGWRCLLVSVTVNDKQPKCQHKKIIDCSPFINKSEKFEMGSFPENNYQILRKLLNTKGLRHGILNYFDHRECTIQYAFLGV